jgi:hypothetical protein
MKFITLFGLATSLFVLSGWERETENHVAGVATRSESSTVLATVSRSRDGYRALSHSRCYCDSANHSVCRAD